MRTSRLMTAGVLFVGMVMVTVVWAQQPGRQFGGGGQGFLTTQVLTNKALQEELKITDAQKEKFKGVSEKQDAMRKKMGEAFKNAGGDKDKLKDAFSEIQKEGEKITDEVNTILTADQKKRLKQIGYQQAGVRAFQDEDVVKALSLTDDQKSKIKGITDDYNKASRELFGGGGGFGKGKIDPDKAADNAKKREKLRKEAMGDINDALTADQKKTWNGLVGEPFDLTKLQGGFGGLGGGRPTPKKD